MGLPRSAAKLFDKLVPTVYAAEPETQGKDPQVARPKSEEQQPLPQSQQPRAILSVDRTQVATGQVVTARVELSPGKIVRSTFHWGDGLISADSLVPISTKYYKEPGNYVIQASVIDDRGVVTTTAPVAIAVVASNNSSNQTQNAVSPPISHSSTGPELTLPLKDDDLILVTCSDEDGCRALGRSGRVYAITESTTWAFTQASFVVPVEIVVKSKPLLLVYGDQHGVVAKSGDVFCRCTDPLRDSGPTFPRPVQYACSQLDMHLAVGSDNVIKSLTLSGQTVDLLTDNSAIIASKEWKALPNAIISTDAPLHSTAHSSDVGFAVGDHGIILSTKDGNTWQHETQGPEGAKPNHRLPAPWYWALAILLIITCAVVVALPVEPVKAERSIADWAVTDAPLKPGDTDSLDFMPMALGLSRFIRNPKTQPPVTIAIEGEWGSGKSSVMSLLRGDLEKSRYRPVWFNAWHHQSEEQLLAALLEHIKDQAIPPWWHIDNWIFRGRLVYNRFHRKWPLLIVLFFLFSAATTYEFSHHPVTELIDAPENLIPFKKYIQGFFESKAATPPPAGAPTPGPNSGPGGNSNQGDLGHLGLLLSFLAVVGAVVRAAKAFGINSAKLTDNLRSASSIKDLKPDPASRRQFAREFGDFCGAWEWGSRRVIIFIDDLDRCRPESVVTVLESINFLTTSGSCMIVLGMAQDQVTHAVGLGFKEIAEAEAAYDGTANTDKDKATARFKYGKLYIKKLVNIIAPIPATTIEQRRRVLEARAAEAGRQEEQKKITTPPPLRIRVWEWLSELGLLVRKMAPVGGLVLAVIFSIWSGYQMEAPVPQPAAAPKPSGYKVSR